MDSRGVENPHDASQRPLIQVISWHRLGPLYLFLLVVFWRFQEPISAEGDQCGILAPLTPPPPEHLQCPEILKKLQLPFWCFPLLLSPHSICTCLHASDTHCAIVCTSRIFLLSVSLKSLSQKDICIRSVVCVHCHMCVMGRRRKILLHVKNSRL